MGWWWCAWLFAHAKRVKFGAKNRKPSTMRPVLVLPCQTATEGGKGWRWGVVDEMMGVVGCLVCTLKQGGRGLGPKTQKLSAMAAGLVTAGHGMGWGCGPVRHVVVLRCTMRVGVVLRRIRTCHPDLVEVMGWGCGDACGRVPVCVRRLGHVNDDGIVVDVVVDMCPGLWDAFSTWQREGGVWVVVEVWGRGYAHPHTADDDYDNVIVVVFVIDVFRGLQVAVLVAG
jgi:hypothetical protein